LSAAAITTICRGRHEGSWAIGSLLNLCKPLEGVRRA
jgi:hypothetical protein